MRGIKFPHHATQPYSNREDDRAADDDLDNGFGQRGFHEAIADEGNRDEFDDHDHVRQLQRDIQIAAEKWEGMKHSPDGGRYAGDGAAGNGVATAGDGAVVGKAFGQAHTDSRTD